MATQLEQVFAADRQSSLNAEAKRVFGELIQLDQYVGDIYSISYESALVQIHDNHRMKVGGIPSLSFLIATRVNPNKLIDYKLEDSSIVLLRVMDAAQLPNAAEAERIRVEVAQRVSGDPSIHWDGQEAMDGVTQNLLSFAGVKCRVIGTFFLEPGANDAVGRPTLNLRFGSDLSNYYPNRGLKVYKPNGRALARIVNYRDPERLHTHAEVTVNIGEVRYASTNREFQGVTEVPVSITPTDLLGQKTALFGMTRTGKSNTTKIILKSVFDLRYEPEPRKLRVGQLVFDANGEYANENTQDASSGRNAAAIKNLRDARSDSDPADVVTYGITGHPNDPQRRLMLLNFYLEENLQTGKQIIDQALAGDSVKFIRNFVQVTFKKPDEDDKGELTRYRRRVLCYRALLKKAGLEAPASIRPDVKNLFGKPLRAAMAKSTGADSTGHEQAAALLESGDISWDQMAFICERLYDFMIDKKSGYSTFEQKYAAKKEKELDDLDAAFGLDEEETDDDSGKGDSWADDDLKKILAMFHFPNGSRQIGKVAPQHTTRTAGDYAEDIYDELVEGKLIIVDQSSGDEEINRANASRLMEYIFRQNQDKFRKGQLPTDILIYVEEAHTILPPESEKDLSNIWVKTAKEGGKYHLGLVYATREVSSIQRNIVKNTANFLIAHLNNTDETRELCKYYDFADFESSIRRAQDRGFLRVKTLSNVFVVPVQIKRFEV